MATNRASAKANKVAGQVEEAAGEFLDDPEMEFSGQVRQVDAALQDLCIAVREQVTGTACEVARSVQRNPITAVATAGLVGFALGLLCRRH